MENNKPQEVKQLVLFVTKKGILRVGFEEGYKYVHESFDDIEYIAPRIDGVIVTDKESRPIELEDWQINSIKYDLRFINIAERLAFKIYN